jgi:hypothetical protein
VTEDRPEAGGATPPAEQTPSWPRRAARAAAAAAWEDLSDTTRRWLMHGKGTARDAWSRRPPRVTAAARLFLVAAAVAGAVSLLAQTGLPARLPTELDWRAAAALLERDARPGDVVVLSPAWAERARSELPARFPVFALERYAGEPLLGVRRAWLVGLSNAPRSRNRIARDIAARASSDGGSQQLGGLTVTRYDLAVPARALAFLPDRLPTAQVQLGSGRCGPGGSLAPLLCPGSGQQRVAREVREVAGAPRTCLTAPPGSPATGPMTLTFPAVPMGLLLKGGAGVVGSIPSETRTPIRVAVQIEGQEVAAVELPAGAPAWIPFEARTGALSGEARSVTVVLSTPDPAGRTVCFDGWTVP